MCITIDRNLKWILFIATVCSTIYRHRHVNSNCSNCVNKLAALRFVSRLIPYVLFRHSIRFQTLFSLVSWADKNEKIHSLWHILLHSCIEHSFLRVYLHSETHIRGSWGDIAQLLRKIQVVSEIDGGWKKSVRQKSKKILVLKKSWRNVDMNA